MIQLGAAKVIHTGAAKVIQVADNWGILCRKAEDPLRRRKDMHDLQELVRQHRMGTRVREAARVLGMSPNTHLYYREVLGEAGLLDGSADALPDLSVLRAVVPQRIPRQQVSTASRWYEQVKALVCRGIQPRGIYDRLRMDHTDFDASYDAIKRLSHALRREAPVRAEDVVIPVTTAAGEVAQVDFGYAGKIVDPTSGKPRRAWVFVMVLGHSRHLYAEVVFDQTVGTWLDLHAHAFAAWGGTPRTVVPDNLKAAVVRAAFGVDEDAEAQRDYRELARFFGFRIDPTPPRSPEKKGKVERAVAYVCRFLATRDPQADLRRVNAELARWNQDIASQRIHGTTGRMPATVFHDEERARLLPLPPARYERITWRKAKVHRDAHVQFQRRFYSVPWEYLGKEAWIRASVTEVEIRIDDVRVAVHSRNGVGLRSTLPRHLPEYRVDLAERSPTVWRERAVALGPEVAAWVDEQWSGDTTVSALKRIQASILFLETLPPERAERVCARARAFGMTRLAELRNVVARGLDQRDLPHPEVAPAPGLPSTPRYARAIGELFLRHAEVNRGWQ